MRALSLPPERKGWIWRAFFLRAIALELCHGCHCSRKQMEEICPVAEKMYKIWTQRLDLRLNARSKEVRWKKITIVNVEDIFSEKRWHQSSLLTPSTVFRHPSVCGMSLNLVRMNSPSEKCKFYQYQAPIDKYTQRHMFGRDCRPIS